MSSQRSLQQLDTFNLLIEEHTNFLNDLEADLPQHESIVSDLRHQFEGHVSLLLSSVAAYATVQRSITTTL
jgi:hypothetical protein